MNAETCQPWLVKLEFQRVQTYLFAVPDLKSMVGANTLLGEVLRGSLVDDGDSSGFAIQTLQERGKPKKARSAATGELDADNLPADNLPADNLPADNLPALAV